MILFVLLIAFHLSCSPISTWPLGFILLFIYSPFPNIREIINHLQNFLIHSFLDSDGRKNGTALVRFSFMFFKVDLGIISPISILNVLSNTSCCDFLTNTGFSELHSGLLQHICVTRENFLCEVGSEF
jgi:hypothetical protein